MEINIINFRIIQEMLANPTFIKIVNFILIFINCIEILIF